MSFALLITNAWLIHILYFFILLFSSIIYYIFYVFYVIKIDIWNILMFSSCTQAIYARLTTRIVSHTSSGSGH